MNVQFAQFRPSDLGMAATEALVARGSPEKSDSHEGEETPTPRPDGETNILSEEAESSDATSPATGKLSRYKFYGKITFFFVRSTSCPTVG